MNGVFYPSRCTVAQASLYIWELGARRTIPLNQATVLSETFMGTQTPDPVKCGCRDLRCGAENVTLQARAVMRPPSSCGPFDGNTSVRDAGNISGMEARWRGPCRRKRELEAARLFRALVNDLSPIKSDCSILRAFPTHR